MAIGLSTRSRVSDDFFHWFGEAALLCASHPLAVSNPAKAVFETAEEEAEFEEWGYVESSADFKPTPPEYEPGLQTPKEYHISLDEYIENVRAWHLRQGEEEVSRRIVLDKHLIWLAWALVECVDDGTISTRDWNEADKTRQKIDGGGPLKDGEAGVPQLVDKAVTKALWTGPHALARIIGIMRNSV